MIGVKDFFLPYCYQLVSVPKWSAEVRALGRKENSLKIGNVMKKAGKKKHIEKSTY